MDFTYCAPETKGTQWNWQQAHWINPCWNWRAFCRGGSKRPQPALVPGPDKVFPVQCCGHISSWPCTEVTDAHGRALGLGLPGELVERGLDCGGKAVRGWGAVDKVAVCRIPDAAAREEEWTRSPWQAFPVPIADMKQALVGSPTCQLLCLQLEEWQETRNSSSQKVPI